MAGYNLNTMFKKEEQKQAKEYGERWPVDWDRAKEEFQENWLNEINLDLNADEKTDIKKMYYKVDRRLALLSEPPQNLNGQEMDKWGELVADCIRQFTKMGENENIAKGFKTLH